MGYTKDITFDIKYNSNVRIIKFKIWTSRIKKAIAKNKFWITILGILSILILTDITLINYFFVILGKIL